MAPILVVAGSGRMLAQALTQAGAEAVVIDLFADLDTCRHALETHQVPALTVTELARIVPDVIKRFGITEFIYGSGLENQPETLRYLSNQLTVLGNSPAIFTEVQDKQRFFGILQKLAIPFPKVSFNPPDVAAGWLVKPLQGQGGAGILRYTQNLSFTEPCYWQAYQPGIAQSVLFLATRSEVQIIGFNTQLAIKLPPQTEFGFAGIMNSSSLNEHLQQTLTGWVIELVSELGLTGLGSVDFIQKQHRIWLLEVNARPPASMQLYDSQLILRHIAACKGVRVAASPAQSGFSGYQVVYALEPVQIRADFAWPDYCLDLPRPGALIHTGQPICSIIAHRNKPRRVMQQLLHCRQHVINQLKRC